jgi:hypothetical protein
MERGLMIVCEIWGWITVCIDERTPLMFDLNNISWPSDSVVSWLMIMETRIIPKTARSHYVSETEEETFRVTTMT